MPARRRIGFVAASALALAAAAVLALLSNAVFAVDRHLDDSDARLGSAASALQPVSSPSGFRFRVAEKMLAAGDDRAFREALELFRASHRSAAPSDALSQHGRAEVELSRLANQGDDLARRSRAVNLLGILAFEDAELDMRFAQRHLEVALKAFQTAVGLDPGNEDAKFNLELVLALLTSTVDPRGSGESQQGSGGVDLRPPGTGY